MTRTGVAALFPGQGSQIVGMARRSVEGSPAAARFFDAASAAIDTDLREFCWDSSLECLTRTENLQPALTASALANWLADQEKRCSSPMEADRFAGHSVGALPAAVAAGHLSPVQGVQLAALRGRLMASAPPGGGMLAVVSPRNLDVKDQRSYASDLATRFDLDVAAINGPTQIVVAGAIAHVEEARRSLAGRAKQLVVSNAFHSRFMQPVVSEWEAAVAELALQPGHGYVTCTTGDLANDCEDVRDDLRAGLTSPVLWRNVMDSVHSCASLAVYGPGRAIVRLARPYLEGRRVLIYEGEGRP